MCYGSYSQASHNIDCKLEIFRQKGLNWQARQRPNTEAFDLDTGGTFKASKFDTAQ